MGFDGSVDISSNLSVIGYCVWFQNDKKNGWVNVGELEGCVHFKIGKWHVYDTSLASKKKQNRKNKNKKKQQKSF